MSSRKYPSGSFKRQQKKNADRETKKLKGSLLRFLSSDSAECAETKNQVSSFETGVQINQSPNVMKIASHAESDSTKDKLNQNTVTYIDDAALWPSIISEEMKDYFILNKPTQYIDQIHKSRKLCADKDRALTEYNFFRFKQNGEKISRDWLVYSPSKGAVFCYVCKLLSSSQQSLCKEGFSDWKNVSSRLHEHENSKTHRESVCALSLRQVSRQRIDVGIVEELEKECNYWRSVLTRVVATVKFLAERGLPVFGDDETIGSSRNGNFLGCLELISKFDPFIANHLEKKGNPGKGNTNYLSSTIVTELMQLMSEKVLKHIIIEIKEAKYFGLIVDATPDITHTDQLSIILRYVNKEGDPNERFIKFIPQYGHDALSLATNVQNLLQDLDLDISNCRGQSYDNASNMSGKYSGLQARIKSACPFADYVPCSAHSLNLVGTNAVDSCNQAVSFFGIIQSVYNFFSASTHRWDILQRQLLNCPNRLNIKSLSNTRWSSKADATSALRKGYILIRQALSNISQDGNEIATSRHEAGSLFSKLCKFETALLTVVWDTILNRINATNKQLQDSTLDISSLVPLYDALIKFIFFVRDNFDSYELEAQKLVDEGVTYSTKRKKGISKHLDTKFESECHLSPKENFRISCFNVICDALIVQLSKRMEAYSNFENKFGFLCNVNLSVTEITDAAKKFGLFYFEDIDDNFCDEFLHFGPFLKQCISPRECLKKMKSLNISHTFPNVETAFRIFLTLPVSNCSSERTFSVLKRIKNRLRSRLTQDNLQAFSILSIENDITSKLEFDDIINDFALKKSRKKPLIL